MTINQSSQNAAINWQGFSIGQGESVSFVQPNGSAVALNRVLGADPSSIMGSLSANGKVFLVNPNGVLFGQGAQVNVGGLVASTLNIRDEAPGDADNIASVERHMAELLRVPTLVAGTVMPDACPSGSAPGTIPVGGVVAAKDAIHPGMHSADICCSMALTVLGDVDPRAVLDLVNAPNAVIQGNYLRHDYNGGFSQGFNLVMQGASGNALAEHNVVRGGSWPIQSFGGEFRYNLVIDSGHNFWRGAADGTQIHHNVFAHTSGPNTGYEGAFKFYGGESGLSIYNNTFDVGGAIGQFDSAAFNIGPGSVFQSIRNNLFTSFSNVNGFGGAFVSAPEGQVATPRVTSADYNAWYNPLATNSVRYLPGIVGNAPGEHDVIANPFLSGTPDVPYRISEGCIWLRSCAVGQVLSYYREMYRPAAGSPLIGAGDPADGPGTAIGAVGPNTSNPVDRFGRIVP